jgi:hypothetical protein
MGCSAADHRQRESCAVCLPGSTICDPELLGFGLHRILPPRLRGDVQDFPALRQGVHEALDLILRSSGGTVITPMTLIEPEPSTSGFQCCREHSVRRVRPQDQHRVFRSRHHGKGEPVEL